MEPATVKTVFFPCSKLALSRSKTPCSGADHLCWKMTAVTLFLIFHAQKWWASFYPSIFGGHRTGLPTGFVGPIIQECFSKNIGQVDHIVSAGPRGDEHICSKQQNWKHPRGKEGGGGEGRLMPSHIYKRQRTRQKTIQICHIWTMNMSTRTCL